MISSPHPKTVIDVMACPRGGVGDIQASAATSIANKYHSWLRFNAVESPGFLHNLEYIGANKSLWKTTVVMSSPSTNYLASKKAPDDKKKTVDVKFMYAYENAGVGIVTFDPNIKTIYDLEGKKLGVGYLVEQGEECIVPQTLLGKDGAGIIDQIDMKYLGTMGYTNGLINGTLDACLFMAVTGNAIEGPWVATPQGKELLATGKQLYYLSWPKDVMEKVHASTGLPLIPLTLPSGTFKYQQEDWMVNLMVGLWAVKDSFPEDLAYEATKFAIDNMNKFGDYGDFMQSYSLKAMSFAMTRGNSHPGAIRAWHEFGIALPDNT